VTPDDLAAIKARAGALTPFVDAVENHPMQLTDTRPEVVDLLVALTKTAEDVPALLARVAELEALVNAKQAWIDGAKVDLDGYDEARAEVERLRDDLAARDLLVKALDEDAAEAREREAEKDAEIARLRAQFGHMERVADEARIGWATALVERDEDRAAVERVRALHHDYDDDGHCDECGERRPCPTLAALDGPERPTAPATPTTDGGA
jgi:chromosome segregation ATPase